jgi:DNA-binding response OmpR family regulator
MHEVREPAALASKGDRILVVDDEPAVLELAQESLERSGFEVLTAPGGREGVEVFRANGGEVDAVVLDVEQKIDALRRFADEVIAKV